MAEPPPSRARSEVASALGRVTGDLTLLEELLAVLRRHDGSDPAVVEAAVAVKMASGAIAPTAKAWQAEPDPAMVDVAGRTGRLLRSSLAGGAAHLATQAGQPHPCVAGRCYPSCTGWPAPDQPQPVTPGQRRSTTTTPAGGSMADHAGDRHVRPATRPTGGVGVLATSDGPSRVGSCREERAIGTF